MLLLLLLTGCNIVADLDEPTKPDQINAQAEGSDILGTADKEVENLSEPVSELSEVSGNVQIKQTAEVPFTDATSGDLLFNSGQVQTAVDGRTRLDFSDGTFGTKTRYSGRN